MIRRDDCDRWLLVPQPEHARMSGELAARWRERPVDAAVALAIGHHDDGWIDWERAPRAGGDTGRPLHFPELPVEDHLAIWRRGPALVAARDPYSGILVSHHGSGLTEMKLRFSSALSPADRTALKRYLDEQRVFRERVAREAGLVLDFGRVGRDVALLRLLDFLSLVLCCGPAETRTIEADGLSLSLAALGDQAVAVAPWPFGEDVERFELAVEARALARDRWHDVTLPAAFAGAERVRLGFEFVRPG